MDDSLSGLCAFFAVAKERSAPLVMATVLGTAGSTYRKAGARILIDADGAASGLLSGGCLEADLRERAAQALAKNRPQRATFDARDSDDPVWGLGMGCEGSMEIWLQPALPPVYPGVAYLQRCLQTESVGVMATVVGGAAGEAELGVHGTRGMAPADALEALLAECAARPPAQGAELRRLSFRGRDLQVFVAEVGLPASLLLCGGGADAIPVQTFAAALGWRVTVYDHRPAFACAERFVHAVRVICARPEELALRLDTLRFDAAVVMSHHLAADAAYLRILASKPPPYIGLLGPAARRQRLFVEAGEPLQRIAARIHGPVGLDIGAASPQAIALAIVAHIQAVLAGRPGGPFAPG
ncbi:MAG TPA: XdhC family protein [Steroidobacteraceae bacterium]|nr:XdhC family protein [Steroidobacteraceae bacterium]